MPRRIARGLSSEPGEARPRIRRSGQAVAIAHDEVVVAAEEGIEAQGLGCLGDGEQVVVARALLRFGEDAEVHPTSLDLSRTRESGEPG